VLALISTGNQPIAMKLLIAPVVNRHVDYRWNCS